MRFRSSAVLLAVFFATTACQPQGSEGDSTPAAHVNGKTITVAEVDEWIKNELFSQATSKQDPAKLHETRASAVDSMISRQLLDREAEARGITSDELLEQQAQESVEVSEAEIAAFFAQNQSRMGAADLDSLRERIRSHLASQKGAEAAQRFISELREQAQVEVLLEVPRVEVAATGPSRGPEDAAVTIIEFSDYQCPFCKRSEEVVNQVLERYEGTVRFVFRHFPLESIHPLARGASQAAVCALEQGKFWEFHEQLFSAASSLEAESLQGYAGDLELDVDVFRSCVGDARSSAVVQEDLDAGRALGVTGTPAFFINGIKLQGAQPLEEFVRIIDGELGSS